jgi:hypothetical protein
MARQTVGVRMDEAMIEGLKARAEKMSHETGLEVDLASVIRLACKFWLETTLVAGKKPKGGGA